MCCYCVHILYYSSTCGYFKRKNRVVNENMIQQSKSLKVNSSLIYFSFSAQ